MKLEMDKIAHLGIGGMITACATLVAILQEEMWICGVLAAPCIGHVCTFILSYIKEKIVDDAFDWKDILAAMIGSAVIHIAVGVGVLFSVVSQ